MLGQVYATNQAAFLAGYLAAGMSKTGVIGTFGGINIGGPVTDFMDGFVWGADYYNKEKGTKVKVLGWDPAKKDGVFVGDFNSIDKGKDIAKSMDRRRRRHHPAGGRQGRPGPGGARPGDRHRQAQGHRRRHRPVRHRSRTTRACSCRRC